MKSPSSDGSSRRVLLTMMLSRVAAIFLKPEIERSGGSSCRRLTLFSGQEANGREGSDLDLL